MRILVTTSTYPAEPDGGDPRFVHDLSVALARRADVRVLAPATAERHGDADLDGVRIRRFAYFRPLRLQRLAMGSGIPDNLRNSWVARIQVPSFLACEVAATRRLVREFAPDVVHAHWLLPQGLTATLACLGLRRPPRIVVHVHGGDAHFLARMPLGSALARFVLDRAVATYASSSVSRESLRSLTGRTDEIDVQPMGVDVARIEAVAREAGGPDRDRLVFVGRLIELKGLIHLIRALPAIRSRRPEVTLDVVGDGPERDTIEAEIEALELRDAVRLLGRAGHEDVIQHLGRASVVVIPSCVDRHGRFDGMPTVVLESMACGRPPVATRVGGIPDVVRHGDNGWLCAPGDPAALASAILEALETGRDPDLDERARRTAHGQDWAAIAERLMDRFEREAG